MASPDPSYNRGLIVAGACMVQFMVIGLMFGNGLFVKVFEVEFGWSRTIVATASSLTMLMMGVFAMGAGRLNDLYGPKIVLTISGIVYGIGYILMGQISEIWQLFVIFGLFLALGMSTHDVVTLSVVARWFEGRRGIMTGVVKVGTAVGQISIPPVLAVLIGWLGWREAVMVLGITAAIVLVAAAMLMRLPVQPAGQAAAPQSGSSYAEAKSGPILWRLCLAQFLFFPILLTVPFHIVAHGMDMGLSREMAAILLSVSGASSVVGRLIVGTFADRIGGRNAYVLCFVPLILAVSLLIFIDIPWMLYAVIGLYGFGHGGLFTVVSPTVAEFFGMRAHGAIFGTVLFCGTVGGAVGPILAGWVFDTTGAYTIAFATLAAFGVAALVLVLSLPRRGHVVLA